MKQAKAGVANKTAIIEGACATMEVIQKREFSGRLFSDDEIALINEVTAAYPKLSRAELASTVCELIGWTQINGNPKTVQCMRFLRGLEEEGVLTLPTLNERVSRGGADKGAAKDPAWVDASEIRECDSIKLEIIRPGDGLRQWRYYMRTYHRLGDPNVYGNQVRYAIKAEDGRDLGCMLFSASSWSLMPRDEWIGWNVADRKTRLHLVVNHSRYLLLPWVHVHNLASRALSMAARRIQNDWLDVYCYAPVLLETFVDTTIYKGTCYKAANWIYLGETRGRGRNDPFKEHGLTRKAIYMYPLQHDFRAVLTGEKQFKVAAPFV